jgi:hypothetical protein
MRRVGRFLLAASIVVAGTAGVAFLLYKNEIGGMRDAASQGSLVVNLGVGPIECTPITVREFRCYRSMAPAAALTRASPMQPDLWVRAFGYRSIALRVSADTRSAGRLSSRPGYQAAGVSWMPTGAPPLAHRQQWRTRRG